MRAKRARRVAAQNFGDTLDTLVPLTARHCTGYRVGLDEINFERPKP